jgi:hypothetical protein
LKITGDVFSKFWGGGGGHWYFLFLKEVKLKFMSVLTQITREPAASENIECKKMIQRLLIELSII